jgi:hypothetical protein
VCVYLSVRGHESGAGGDWQKIIEESGEINAEAPGRRRVLD